MKSNLDLTKNLLDDLIRTMRITTNARFEASKRLSRINFICFISTTVASLGLILIPLLDLADMNKAYSDEVLTCFQIFLAVSVLVYSAAISTANYQIRSKEYLKCADQIKSLINKLKFEMSSTPDITSININNYQEE